MDSPSTHSRRAVLTAGLAVAGGSLLASSPGAAAATPGQDGRRADTRPRGGRYVDPHGPEVAEAEQRRASSGRVRRLHVEAQKARIDIGSRTVDTWVYGDRLPGEVVRITAGDTLSMTFRNSLPQSTTLHWHGLALRNDMDGVPDVTQRPIRPGDSFDYRFRVTQPGTYWFHPHVGVQQDHGLYAPLIIDDPKEPLEYDHEWVVVLDDWLDGVDGSDPDVVLNELNHGRGSMHGNSGSGEGHDSDGGHAHASGGHGEAAGHGNHGTGHDSSTGHGTSNSNSNSNQRDHSGHGSGSEGTAVPAWVPPAFPDVDLDRFVPHVNGPGDLGLDLANKSLHEVGLGNLPLHGMSATAAAAAASAGAASREAARASRGARRDDGPGHGRNGPSRLLKSGARSDVLGGMPGSVNYPYHLINGRTKTDPEGFRARPGDRIRIRFINAGGDTAYRVALGGHHMTVTHTDGYPVQHARAEQLLIGMAERYDVLVTAKSGVFPLVAVADGKGKDKTALAVLRTGNGPTPEPSVHPRELEGPLTTADRLRAAEGVRGRSGKPDRVLTMKLMGNMERFNWSFNGYPYTPSQRYAIEEGERVRLVFRNRTAMWHPVHLHGHSFTLPNGGPRKDTTVMRPGQRLAVDFDANNPGLWMLHCHNIYHSESGMMTVLGYRRK
ncbi:multicopper oxidase family protein [Streptomyces noursei]|uniref:multicopper oxidase family protein n=1 Tax=Streptomyces noursei TaxID=1971 RepID=UPI00099D4CE1|nr:multicopper oxidase family protein [Streptomyces noursei]